MHAVTKEQIPFCWNCSTLCYNDKAERFTGNEVMSDGKCIL